MIRWLIEMLKKILLVDDNTDFTYVVKRRLIKMNTEYDVVCAASGKECFDLLNSGTKPDLILLDIMLPEMNGWDIFTKLKQNPTYAMIPIIFLTAKTDSYSKGFGKISASDYIEKPFEMWELKERIDKILQR